MPNRTACGRHRLFSGGGRSVAGLTVRPGGCCLLALAEPPAEGGRRRVGEAHPPAAGQARQRACSGAGAYGPGPGTPPPPTDAPSDATAAACGGPEGPAKPKHGRGPRAPAHALCALCAPAAPPGPLGFSTGQAIHPPPLFALASCKQNERAAPDERPAGIFR